MGISRRTGCAFPLASDDGAFHFRRGVADRQIKWMKSLAKRGGRLPRSKNSRRNIRLLATNTRMTPRKASRKPKKTLPLSWVDERAFEVPPEVRPAAEPRGPANHILFTPPGSNDTSIEVRRP